MGVKMKRVGVVLMILSLLFISQVYAQLGGLDNQLGAARDNLEGNITRVREFTDKDKWDFIGSQWKELLLKNKAIAGIDAFFTKINIVFVVLFAHDWSISIEMLFVFLLWLFTFLSSLSYARSRIDNPWTGFGVSLGVALIFAHALIFNYLATGAVKLVLYKPSAGWRLLIIAAELIALFLYLKLNQLISKSLKKAKEKRDKEKLNEKVDATERSQKTMIETARQVEE